jgi:NADPH2:quinone reductase
MRALLCKELGEPLVVEEVASPPLGPGQVRMGVHVCGVNFADLLVVQGKYQEKPEPPFSPGMESAGEVLEVADGVTNVSPGERVIALSDFGGAAGELVTNDYNMVPIPEGMDYATAAGFGVTYGTAHLALTRRGQLKAGETLLVHAAAGGVGLAAVEIGKALGARVIGTAGGPEKCAVAKEHGADDVFDYKTEDIRKTVKALTDGVGADVIFDPVGGDVFDASLRCIAWEGRLLVIGFASGRIPELKAGIVLVKNISVVGVYWGANRRRDLDAFRESFGELTRLYATGALKPLTSATYDLAEANQAYADLASRKTTGKIVLTTGR